MNSVSFAAFCKGGREVGRQAAGSRRALNGCEKPKHSAGEDSAAHTPSNHLKHKIRNRIAADSVACFVSLSRFPSRPFISFSLLLFLGAPVCNADYPCEGMSRHATFENFGMAFLTLFQVSTGDNWNGIMKVRGCARAPVSSMAQQRRLNLTDWHQNKPLPRPPTLPSYLHIHHRTCAC